MAVPVCQAHRIQDRDPIIRSLAEQSLLLMGQREFGYMEWAAGTADSATARAIQIVMASIRGGAKADPACWPSMQTCLAHTQADDEVVAIMAAQIATLRQKLFGEKIHVDAKARVESLLADAHRRPWYVRHGVDYMPSKLRLV